ncbi:pinin [Biomphalaria pfeifferi]|uniref:Pinin n=1 Tax=Biomphalaria pfeifferi TaxID=112525 RepID=A0AAD8FDZ2_BIOPF|nr:pinin [Biomphalaria pfeifferi]
MAELNLSGVEVLQSEIEKSKDKLRNYNENIKKLTGRDPNRPGVKRLLSGEGVEREEDGYSGRIARGRGRLFGLARRGIMDDSGPPTKRRVIGGGAFTRLGPAPVPARQRAREDSPYEEEPPTKLSVQSSVVSTSRETKSRKEIMQEQTKDKDGMQRNRRMFGLLLGTLNKFKTESKTLETKEVQRKKIEEKLEEIAEKEKKKFKLETKLLMEEMHIEQSKISRLEQKMEMVQEHADRAKEMEKLKNFITTKAKPRIFWKPVHNSSMIENKLKESKKVVDEMLQEGKDRLEKEIKELMEREYKREERIKMRLREDGLFGDEDEAVRDDQGNKESNEVVVVGGANREAVTVGGVNRDIKQELESSFNKADAEGSESPPSRDQLKSKSRRTVVLESEKEEKSEADSDIDDTEGGRETNRKDLDTVNRKKQSKEKEDESSSEEEDNAIVERRESEGREAKRSVELQISDRSRESQRLKKTDNLDVERERGEKQDTSRSEKQRLKESDEFDDDREKGKVQSARKRDRRVSKESDESDDERERKKRQDVRRTEKQRSKESDQSDDDRERGKKQDGRRERKRVVIAEKESDKKENESHRKELTSKGAKQDSRHVRKDKDRLLGHTNSKHHKRDSRDSHDSDSSSDNDSDSKKDRKRDKEVRDKRSKDHSRRSRERAVSGKNSKNISSTKNDSDSDNSKH